jgi:cobyrinic acid a,c-diamide synthase
MGFQPAVDSFARHAVDPGINVIEGNRGIYDGLDAQGTHSTAELAKALAAPVILVINATKVTRTAAALVLGCQKLDPGVRFGGVVLNQVAGARHERVIRQAVESCCGLPILGAIPRNASAELLPSRHLGLVTPHEHPAPESLARDLLAFVNGRLDIDGLLEISRGAPPIETPPQAPSEPVSAAGLLVGYLNDSAFCFYYPENLEALRAAGATLIPISPLLAAELPPDLDALYIGGGFPETHARRLSENAGFLASLQCRAREGMPVYAECGGLMLLSRAIAWQGTRYPMAAVLNFDVEVLKAPQGHGYIELTVDRPNGFFPAGTRLRGHEFHYSRIILDGDAPPTACSVSRGVGCFSGRDAVTVGNVWAGYTHLHALATPEWARAFLRAAASAKAPA